MRDNQKPTVVTIVQMFVEPFVVGCPNLEMYFQVIAIMRGVVTAKMLQVLLQVLVLVANA